MITKSRQLLQISTSFANESDAQTLLHHLLSERLVACGHISIVQSSYWWDGAIQKEKEYLLSLKTRADLYAAVEKAIIANHPYTVPCIIATEIVQMNDSYRDWVLSATKSSEVV